MTESGEGFLARWSRRKLAAGRPVEPRPAPDAVPAPPPAGLPEIPAPAGALRAEDGAPDASDGAPAPIPPAGQQPAFDPASLPPVESLTAASDVTAFLRKEVPAALRDAALRRVWTLDPAIRDFIGPADYAWDFNTPDSIPGFSARLGEGLEKLLAQAIGAAPPPEAGTAEITVQAPSATLVDEGAAPAARPEGEGPPGEAPTTTPTPAAAPAAAAGPAEAAAPSRRRHGGALPA
jgi:hypothetical protein